ncbi:MAG: aldo/keto reductase, partial [Oceanospirillaceae bacterium]|nr:aldo/keto reductase [Oceanospirillaceae bacterium]
MTWGEQVRQQPFVLSTIIGATSMEQLKTNIASQDIELDKDQLKAINKIHATQP